LYCFWYAEEIEGEKKKLVRKKDTARKENGTGCYSFGV
jgi:hypothetical protein